MSRSPRIQRKLDALADKRVNYDPDELDFFHPPAGWRVDDRFQALSAEPSGDPVADGSWETAARLIRGYEFADPSIVRAFYDGEDPYAGRNMLLELRALGLVSIHVGVRVHDVYNQTRTIGGSDVRVFGWSYRTLEGHVEQGQMDWEVWKWLDTGEVQFHVRAVSRPASISNPAIAIGFRILRGHERSLFLDSTDRRMVTFTELGLTGAGRGDRARDASRDLTARSLPEDDAAHESVAGRIEPGRPAS